MHLSNGCDVICSNYDQEKLNPLAIDAFDRDSVLGDKPKIYVSLIRTMRVKKDLAKIKKEKAALNGGLVSGTEI